jgi:hypothetical protein
MHVPTASKHAVEPQCYACRHSKVASQCCRDALWTPDKLAPSYVFTVSRPLYDDSRLCAARGDPDSHGLILHEMPRASFAGLPLKLDCQEMSQFEQEGGVSQCKWTCTSPSMQGTAAHTALVASCRYRVKSHRLEEQLWHFEPVRTELQLLPVWKLRQDHRSGHRSLAHF